MWPQPTTALQTLQNGQREAGGFAGTRLRGGQHIAA
jgi:hypothetical protein